MIVETRFPGSIAVTMFSDHVIEHMDPFLTELSRAIGEASHSDKIITIGTKPDEPNPHFGYIKLGQQLHESLYEVIEFEEKPNAQNASQ